MSEQQPTSELIDTGSQNVTGYRKQTPDALDTVNEIKHVEEVVAKLWRWVRARPTVPTDPRQLALARTAFEEGFMHLNRAVFQPVDPFEGD
ncbi:Acb2/Tad1 domain-containing protein [Amycolatopsis eburnea]|uniref:Acb2/Tad1 hairpin domain-containing protein n=1 Tax=Amycolatopsis eburnea TaxID=2267691 RepID=A0A427TGJ8_9PSEU|nr:hypothetical protein [Amycolatopsis eburnea]RSD21996.1 hypothetical protein EIY87_09265 [Amycolatopsis eburnea]